MGNAARFFEEASSQALGEPPGWESPEEDNVDQGVPRWEAEDLDGAVEIAPPADTRLDQHFEPTDLPVDSEVVLPQKELESRGWEAVAFYVPHHFIPSRWGIYLVERLLWPMSLDVYGSIPGRSLGWVTQALRDCLDVHELLHFRTEFAATLAEVATQYSIYREYSRHIYQRNYPDAFEESVAVSYQVRRARRLDGAFGSEMASRSRLLPRAYADFEDPFTRKKEHIFLDQLYCDLMLMTLRSSPESLASAITREYLRSVPRYVLLDPTAPTWWRRFVRPQILLLPLRKVLKDARKRGAEVVQGTKHLAIRVDSQKVAISQRSDGVVPFHITKQLAAAYGIDPGTYCEEVLRR